MLRYLQAIKKSMSILQALGTNYPRHVQYLTNKPMKKGCKDYLNQAFRVSQKITNLPSQAYTVLSSGLGNLISLFGISPNSRAAVMARCFLNLQGSSGNLNFDVILPPRSGIYRYYRGSYILTTTRTPRVMLTLTTRHHYKK